MSSRTTSQDSVWRDLVGPVVAGVTRRGAVSDDGLLRIIVLDVRWTSTLRSMEPTLLRKLRTAWGEGIRGIRWS
jgi:predicted nucleic acid-binding Zn ribbon protein